MKVKKLTAALLASAIALTAGFMLGGISTLKTELTASAVNTDTSGTCGENVTWELSDDGVLTISGTGDITEPNYLREEIIKSVVIEEGVTSIGDKAFSYCKSLTSVTIPDTVTSIGKSAFYWCTSLTSVNIPDTVTTIGAFAFSECYRLPRYMVIPPTVESIGICAIGYVYHYIGNSVNSEDYEKIDNYIIYGTAGTAAEKYALSRGFIFIDTSKPVTISEKEYALKTGGSAVLSVDNFPGDILWRSSDRSVADVSMGYVSAKAPGTAMIYAEAGKDTLSCEVTVSKWDDLLTLLGDVNGNGRVNVADAFMLQQYLVNKEALTNIANADLNGDGRIDVFDGMLLKRMILADRS